MEKKKKKCGERKKSINVFNGINSRQSEGLNDDKVKAFLCCLHFPNHIRDETHIILTLNTTYTAQSRI